MTREDAIKMLRGMKADNLNLDDLYTKDKYEALDMAIKALEQEPCEDCISREEAKQFLYERLDRLNDDELYDIFSRIIDDMYNELPSVIPQPKTGHLIFTKTIFDKHGCTVECSNCHKKWKTYDTIRFEKEYKYCPNCGAKMFEPQGKRCADCNHYGKLSLDCGRCDDDCSMYEPQERSDKE